MGLFGRRKAPPIDLELISGFGRYTLLGWEAAGEPSPFADWWNKSAPWREPLMSGPADRNRAIAMLNDVAVAQGGWVAVGAWKLMLEFGGAFEDVEHVGAPALEACMRAYDEFGITNLDIHIATCEIQPFERVVGRRPPMDGFWGPPVFTTGNGPTKQHYLDHAALFAARRNPSRLSHIDGVPPAWSSLDTPTGGLGDFARLIVMGPLRVPVDVQDEHVVLAPQVRLADGVDHSEVLAGHRRALESVTHPAWAAVGAARFCQDYLDASLAGSVDHLAVVDLGLPFLRTQGALTGNLSPECLSPLEKQRLQPN